MNHIKYAKYGVLFLVLAVALAACARATPTPTPVPPTPTPEMMKTTPAEEGGQESMKPPKETPTPPMMDKGEQESMEMPKETPTPAMMEEEGMEESKGPDMGPTEEKHEEGIGEEMGEMVLSGAAAEGYEIYRQVGCAACHGEQGEGGIGPALAGHTPEQVRKQVRNPVGDMPAFSQEQLSDEDLEKIVAFVESLGSAEVHGHPQEDLTPIHVHHLMTLLALQNENIPDAIHHLEHAIALAEDETQKQELKGLVDLLKEGEVHDVEHDLQNILGNMQPEVGATLVRLEAQLALEMLGQENIEEARHAVEHIVSMTTGEEQKAAREILELLAENNVEGAEVHLRELLGEGGQHTD